MPGTGIKVCLRCRGVVGGWFKPIIVFNLAQAEQNSHLFGSNLIVIIQRNNSQAQCLEICMAVAWKDNL